MPDAGTSIRLIIVDDHTLFRESLARFLAAEAGFQVAGDCASIDEALEILRSRHVDIVLLDFDLGAGPNGSHFMRLARQRGFEAKVLMVTAGLQDAQAAEAIRMGVAGIFLKDQSATLLAQGIRDVVSGKVWFDPALLQRAVASSREDVAAERFTARERQVLACVLEGLPNKQIAARIGVSESAIKATLQQIFSKTGVRTRSQLVRIVLEQYPNLAVTAE